MKQKAKQEIKGKKPQEKIERFILRPQYTPILGVTVTKDTDIDDIARNGLVHQTIKNLVFTTEINRDVEKDGCKINEYSKLTINLKEGTRLLWSQMDGYVLPETRPVTRKEIKKDLDNLNGIEGLE